MEHFRADIGVIGLAVMGRNLALNFSDRGFRVAVFNHEPEMTRDFMVQGGEVRGFISAKSIRDLVSSLHRPRRILMMIKAGAPVDSVLAGLLPLLSRGDVVMDGGNSNYHDTERRQKLARARGVSFLGVGVSGGEYGARNGPSIMPGGDRSAYKLVAPVLEKAAALTGDGPCCTYVGAGSAGHFTKMVHNGIEYALMQVIAEAWDIMKTGLGMRAAETRDVFEKWNDGPLSSYLVEITAQVLGKMDEKGRRPLVELIADSAGQKGTGKWTTQAALDLGVPVPTITAAVDSRIISGHPETRARASRILGGASARIHVPRARLVSALMHAVRGASLISYGQGLHLLARASRDYGYGIRLAEVCRIWKGGCIIRARELDLLADAFRAKPGMEHLFESKRYASAVRLCSAPLRWVVEQAVAARIPVPALASALSYRDSFVRVRLPSNLIQAQRDLFGAHTFRRIDRPGVFHADWEG